MVTEERESGSRLVTVWLPVKAIQQLKREKDRTGHTVSSLIRRAVLESFPPDEAK